MRWRSGLGCAIATWALFGAIAGTGCLSSSSSDAPDGGQPVATSADGAVDAMAMVGPTDAGADASGCSPVNVSGFSASQQVVPLPPPSTACNGYNGDGGLVQAYADACLGRAATYDTCAAFTVPDAAGAADCYRCLVTPGSPEASTYGAVVFAKIPLVNYASCILALDPTSAGESCAQAVDQTAACDEYACQSECPVTDQASQSEYTACTNAASSGACVGYVLRAEGCLAAEQGDGGTPVADICLGGGGIAAPAVDHFLTMARYFCGGD
jgi:hypothetical protein